MTTTLGLITRSLKLAKVSTKSETPAPDETADALVSLNAMLSSWSNDSLVCYARVTESFTLTPGTASYTIGTGQTFNTARPMFIASAFVRSSSLDYPLEIISDEEYNLFGTKTDQGTPEALNYTTSFPVGRVRLFPTPDLADSLFITSEKEITSLALSDTISFPPGWEDALAYNLTMRIAPEYGQALDPLVISTAKETLGAIRLNVARNRPIKYEPSVSDVGNFYNGFHR